MEYVVMARERYGLNVEGWRFITFMQLSKRGVDGWMHWG